MAIKIRGQYRNSHGHGLNSGYKLINRKNTPRQIRITGPTNDLGLRGGWIGSDAMGPSSFARYASPCPNVSFLTSRGSSTLSLISPLPAEFGKFVGLHF